MTDLFIYSLVISVIYFLFKFLEMKFQSDEDKKPLKFVIKDSLLVYFASLLGIYIYSQFDFKNGTTKNTMAFVTEPSF